ncbi:MAG TPA: ScyD/ScyE family protein, partial [Thermoanaerobaculia bacterium]|nr:ScyD/ScyE family protein [Thermoanaerobaculia bacterium]
MTRIITITTERIRRVIVRCLRSPDDRAQVTTKPAEEATTEEKGNMNKKVIAAFIFAIVAAVPARPQGPPFVAGLQLPSRIAFTRHGNLVVAEAGTPANNTGRVSLVNRATASRRTLIDGLPSGISHAEEPGSPSGPSGVAVQDRTIYLTIGSGDAVLPGPAPGSEQRNATVASPILASLLSMQSSAPLDVTAGGFTLNAADHATLKSGLPVTLHNSADETLTVRLVADFPDFTEEPRPDFAANVRAGNPFGVVAQGQTLYVVDASQNVVRKVDANTGAFTTISTIGKVANPTPVGPPVIDPVPDSIHLRGNDLVVTTLTGFPFPAGKASVLKIDPANGAVATLVSGLTSSIDVAPLGNGANDPLLVLEFSTNMLAGAAGRLRLVTPDGTSTTIAEGLPTPTSMAVDATTGDVFITHIFPGFITRINAAAKLPPAAPTAVVPVVASLAGAFGSHFDTAMQISNPYPFAIAGRIVVHPLGASGSAADASTPYALAPFATQRIDTLITNGAGSADVLAEVGESPVIVTTLTETGSMNRVQIPAVDPEDAITAGMHGTLITPPDPSRQRFNVGIRTLSGGATLTMRVHDSSGVVISSVTRSFAPDYFVQFSFAQLFGASAGASQAVTFDVESGSAIVYGAAVDNINGAM